jgi:endoglycosylceramidase
VGARLADPAGRGGSKRRLALLLAAGMALECLGLGGTARATDPQPALSGQLQAPGGPFLTDRYGRVVILHGVNAVYKLAPYELIAAPGQPWDFSAADAQAMARLGFDVVRLGLTWQGLEPGTKAADDPSVCSEGRPKDAHQYHQSTVDAYLRALDHTVALLGAEGIYSLIDMHQDAYNHEAFTGDGAPDWAVCTNGAPNRSVYNPYLNPAVGVAFDHFWNNDVAGGLQHEYDRVWGAVAGHFAADPWVAGYDVFNEPFSSEVFTGAGNAEFDARLECFYTGTAHPGAQNATGLPLACPPTDPAEGAIASIHAADPHHLVFYEPDVVNDFGDANYVGAMPFPGLVLNFHVYCLANGPTCPGEEAGVFQREASARAGAGNRLQPGGPAWFLSEFGGGGDNYANLDAVTADADQALVGWTYWQWKQYNDPYGGTDEGVIEADGRVDPGKARALSQTYAQAIAGIPMAMSFNPATAGFTLTYRADPAIHAPTVVFVAVGTHYPHGYCATARGARITSPAGATHLVLDDLPGATTVEVRVKQGRC